MKNKFSALVIVLTFHLFFVQTKLLYFLSPEIDEKGLFSLLSMNEHSYLAMLFALSYSLATAFVIYLTKKRYVILVYALLDGLAVGFYYLSAPFQVVAPYFAIYTFVLIASTLVTRGDESLEGKIKTFKKEGMSVDKLSKRFNISKNKIYSLLKQKNNWIDD